MSPHFKLVLTSIATLGVIPLTGWIATHIGKRKTFLITIGDRSVTGMVARDQMVGPCQVPVLQSVLPEVILFDSKRWMAVVAVGNRENRR